MGFKTINEPTSEPIPIAECRLHLRVDDDLTSETALDEAEDADILLKLGAAREYCEGVLGVYLAPRLVEQTLDRFPCGAIILEAGPVRLIDSIEYPLAEDGTPTEIDPLVFSLNDYVKPARVDLAFETNWPTDARAGTNAVRVRYVVGYGTINDSPPDVLAVPKDIRAAMLLILGHLYDNREESTAAALQSIPLGVHALLSLKRVNRGV